MTIHIQFQIESDHNRNDRRKKKSRHRRTTRELTNEVLLIWPYHTNEQERNESITFISCCCSRSTGTVLYCRCYDLLPERRKTRTTQEQRKSWFLALIYTINISVSVSVLSTSAYIIVPFHLIRMSFRGWLNHHYTHKINRGWHY